MSGLLRALHTEIMLLTLCALSACALQTPVPATASRFEFTALRMGVKARVVLYGDHEESARAAAAAAFARIAELEAIMSDYRPDSELSRLSEAAIDRDVEVSQDLLLVLVRAREFSEASGGAFDVTIGPLSALWRSARAEGRLPGAEELREARERVGYPLMEINQGAATVRLRASGMKLDLGGIAKGYAVQEALTVLHEHGHARCLVALAGDIAVGDPPPGAQGWRIAVETCIGEPTAVVLSNACISTSGATEQFVEIGGVRYGHIIDSRTGLGSTRRTAAVVITPDGTEADALGTCLYLLGVEDAATLLRRYPRAAAWVLEDRWGHVREFVSEDFATLRASPPANSGPGGPSPGSGAPPQ
jgi:FAD:protein FMN transferase